MKNFAIIDNSLAAAQLAIGESSNLAQLCLTYTYNYNDQKYQDYVCILSVLAQCAIDNAKRKFDIDLNQEINRIKKDMGVTENGVPGFWLLTKRDKRKMRTDEKRRERDRNNRKKIAKMLNGELVCPMNYLYSLRLDNVRDETDTIDIAEFWIKHEQDKQNYRVSRQVEGLIQKYSIDLYNYNTADEYSLEQYLLLRDDFDELVRDIQAIYISRNYEGLMSWLINRALIISDGVKRNKNYMASRLYKNRSLLLKVLYAVNKKAFLNCFKKNV